MLTTCSSTLLIEDEKVRVTRFDFEPNQETGWHVHEYDYVIIAITNCSMLLQHPDGTETTAVVAAGNAYRRDAGVRHNVINASEIKMSFIEIELKNQMDYFGIPYAMRLAAFGSLRGTQAYSSAN